MTAGHDSCSPILSRKIVQCPHGRNLEFYIGEAHWIETVITVQNLSIFARMNLDRRRTAYSVVAAMALQYGICNLHNSGVSNQICRCPGQSQDAAQSQCPVSIKVILEFMALLGERATQILQDTIHHIIGYLTGNYNAAIPQERSNHFIGMRSSAQSLNHLSSSSGEHETRGNRISEITIEARNLAILLGMQEFV